MTALCTLTVTHWAGALPLPGQYVKSARGRTAFLIVEVIRPKKSKRLVAKFRCERHPAIGLSSEAIIHHWQWAKR